MSLLNDISKSVDVIDKQKTCLEQLFLVFSRFSDFYGFFIGFIFLYFLFVYNNIYKDI